MSDGNRQQGKERSPEEREEAVRAYLATGDCAKAAKLTGLPERTIQTWRTAAWWDEVAARVCQELEEAYRAGWRGCLSGALDVMQDRLEKGNYATDRGRPCYETEADGTFKRDAEGRLIPIRVPVPAKDAIVIAGIAQDKLRLSLGLPTSITKREGDEDRLSKLRKKAEEDRANRAPPKAEGTNEFQPTGPAH